MPTNYANQLCYEAACVAWPACVSSQTHVRLCSYSRPVLFRQQRNQTTQGSVYRLRVGKVLPHIWLQQHRSFFECEVLHGSRPIGFVTVSYTHLRAHETRHDLVCRLLL